ncbi:MAG: LptF/LptG family permease [Candidatus Aminicenantes bacterium]|nr:LptF/LptG family permease [Candidatus Aminicenantes bacterium]
MNPFRMKLFDRYLLREILPPFGLGLLVYSFVLMANQILQYPELFISQGVSFTDSTKLLVYIIPSILGFTVPMAVIMGILAGLGRMSSDSESVALKTLGVSHARMIGPLLLFAVFGWAVTSVLTLYVIPRFNYLFLQTTVTAVLDKAQIRITPQEFNQTIPGRAVYLQDTDPNGDWKRVFVGFTAGRYESRVVLAERGRLNYYPIDKRATVELFDVVQHYAVGDEPQRYEWLASPHITQEPDFRGMINVFNSEKRAREKNIDELLTDLAAARSERAGLEIKKEDVRRRGLPENNPEAMQNGTDILLLDYEVRTLQVEVHKRFALPFVCLIFVFMGLPLGLSTKKGGRTSGFTISLVIILAYYIFLTFGEQLAMQGRASPWLGIWSGNIIFGLVSLVLFVRSARERPFLLKWVQRPPVSEPESESDRRRKAAREAKRRPSLLRLLGMKIPFPDILDRYFIRRYLWIGGLILLSVVSIFSIVTFFDRYVHIAAHHQPVSMLLEYIYYRLPEFFQLGLPMTALMATLLTLGLFYKFNEVTAMKACGVSVLRMIIPAFFLAAVIGGISFGIQENVLPRANRKAAETWNRIRKVSDPAAGMQGLSWRTNKARDMFFNYEYFDPNRLQFRKLWVFEIDPAAWKLKRRLFAETARLGDGEILLENGWVRDFQGADISRPPDPVLFEAERVALPEGKRLFLNEVKDPSQMKYRELGRYIEDVEKLGFDTTRLQVDRSAKLSFPFVAVVMTLLGIPFAFAMGRRGALVGIGVSLAIALVFWTAIGIFKSLGGVGILPVFLASWGPPLLFGALGLFLSLRLKS